ncbi:MAG: discoidin domain-containing protein [Prevotella sp.]|nr:discoidin domain-containing protein [Prevotella sp.]
MKKLFLFLFALVVSIGTAWADKTIYLEPNIWDVNNATEYYAVYAWGGSSDAAWYDMEAVAGTSYYKATIPDDRTGILFTRAGSAEDAKNFDNKWNQTVDITLPNAVNSAAYIITGWDGGDGKSTVKYSAKFPNYALLGTASASTGTAADAIDGNTGTRWESASSDPQTWQVDLGSAKTFNTISIRWEGAYAKTFTIEVGDNVDGDGYLTGGTQIVNVENQKLEGFPYVQNLQFEAKTARYIKFTGTARGTGYGYSFWEFGVYNLAGNLAFTTLEITPTKNSAMVSKTINFTATGKDQLDGVVNPGTLTWNSSNESVGTISDGTFTAIAEGTTNITASANSGEITSNSVTITVTPLIEPTDVPTPNIDAENVKAIFSHHYTEVGAIIEGAWSRTNVVYNSKKALKVNNFAYIQFTLGAEHKAQGMERIHLDVFPAENMPTIVIRAQGDGFSKQKMLDLNNGTWDNDVDFSLTEDLGLTEDQINNITVIQIVKNNVGSGNGDGTEEFYIGNLYFYKPSSPADTEKPVMVTATKGEIAGTTAKVTLNATDNSGHVKYVLTEKDAKVSAITTDLQTAGTDYEYTISGLSQNTEYTFTITAQDAAGNESENNKEVNFTTSNVIGTSGTGVTGTNGGGTAGLEYSYNIEQNGTDINVTFTCTNDGDYTGLVSWIWDNTDGFKEIGSGYATITKTLNYAAGTTIKVACKWAYAGGMSVTDYIEYTVADVAPTPTEGYYIIGSMNEWSINNNYKLTLNETAATTEYYFPSLALTTTSQFKVVYSADGTEKTTYYPEGIGNNYGENGEIASDGNYTIFFRPKGDGGDDWFYNVIYVTSMIDAGVDPTTGAHILTGVWDAAKFASIDAMDKANSYDLTGVDFTGVAKPINMDGKTENPYCMFITKSSGQVNRNEVVWDATNNRYNGYAFNFDEEAGSTAPFDINTAITPIQVENPFFARRFTDAGNYVTLAVPFDRDIPNGHKAYTMSAANSGSAITLTFTEVTTGKLTKNTPYLYYVSDGGIVMPDGGTVTIDWAAATNDQTTAAFVANYRNLTADGTENFYVLPGAVKEGGITFHKVGAGATIRPFRAYITVPAASPARINVVFNDATGIHAATTEQLEGIFNIYSIDGKLVRQNTESKVGLEKGIYIINGKKVVIK